MARVSVEGTDLVVRLGVRERLAAGRRLVRVPVTALRRVYVEPSWWRVLRGAPGAGRWAPGRCVGIRHVPGGDDFVAVRAGSAVLCVDLGPGAPFERVSVAVADPEGTAQTLRAAMRAGRRDRRNQAVRGRAGSRADVGSGADGATALPRPGPR